MADNIVVGSISDATSSTPSRFSIPLNFDANSEQVSVDVSIGTTSLILFFNKNSLANDNLFLSSYSVNRTQIYFAGFKCVFGNYINFIDNGCPFLFYFLDKSNGQSYSRESKPITFESINDGVTLYAELR